MNMPDYSVGQKVRVVNAIGPTIATITEVAPDHVRATLQANGYAYEYPFHSIAPASKEDILAAQKYSEWEAERAERQLHPASFVIPIPAQAKIDADWLCQECGHSWNGPNGKSCPQCGETSMIYSPRGRASI